MISPVGTRWIRLVPLVGLLVLLVRWLQTPQARTADQRLREDMELTDAWIVTLGALLSAALILVGSELLTLW